MTMDTLLKTLVSLFAIALAITLHEAAHGITALWFGDDTAKRSGRVTLNPIKHIDPMGTLILPFVLFMAHAPFILGWAKPVPVDFFRLKPPRLGIIGVALAGPFMNFFLAWISALLLHMNPGVQSLGNEILLESLKINIVLCVFNLLPLPPLDGGRVLIAILPKPLARVVAHLEPYAPLIFMGLILSPLVFSLFYIPFSPLQWAIAPLYTKAMSLCLALSGN